MSPFSALLQAWYLVDSHLDQKQIAFNLAHAAWQVERSSSSTVVMLHDTKIFLRRSNLPSQMRAARLAQVRHSAHAGVTISTDSFFEFRRLRPISKSDEDIPGR